MAPVPMRFTALPLEYVCPLVDIVPIDGISSKVTERGANTYAAIAVPPAAASVSDAPYEPAVWLLHVARTADS